jgi:hypothetical protein
MNMLVHSQTDYQKFLDSLVDVLDITPAQFQKAKDHYEAVGNWLAKEGSPLHEYSPEIYPQGSFRLGTVIKPVSGEDEFDVDLVCKLQLTKNEVTQETLKKMVGDRLKANSDYERMLQDEGQRCWTLDYKETPRFHMDILPAIKDNYGWLLENRVSFDYAQYAICITCKKSDDYSILSDNWNKSNPIGYAIWFRDQMKIQLHNRKKILAESRNVSIETIKEDEIKTPLQRAIQILKRHRDLMFGEDEDKPISIIITTLAAKAYAEEDNLYLALKNILDKMHTFIRVVDGVSIVENPINPLENFAEKWLDYPEREKNFKSWMIKAKEDIYELIERNGFKDSIENLREVFGKRMVNEALNKAGFRALNESTSLVPVVSSQVINVPHKEQPKWSLNLTNNVSIAARYKDANGWHSITPKTVIPKFKDLVFTARTNVKKPFSVYWQVVNTGEEAKNSNCLRGQIFPAKTAGAGGLRHKESTQYTGTHWVECYIIKDGACVARSKELFVKIS